MARGMVKWFNPTKGYGFIQSAGPWQERVCSHLGRARWTERAQMRGSKLTMRSKRAAGRHLRRISRSSDLSASFGRPLRCRRRLATLRKAAMYNGRRQPSQKGAALMAITCRQQHIRSVPVLTHSAPFPRMVPVNFRPVTSSQRKACSSEPRAGIHYGRSGDFIEHRVNREPSGL